MNHTDKGKAPLYEMLVEHGLKKAVPFHVPGHKQRAIRTGEHAEDGWGLEGLLQFDVTELLDTDDFHDPSGAIARAQELAADCFGAEETCFLVGGSTAGNLAMILGVCEPGEIVLVQRNVHKSIIHGLALAGARSVFLEPEIDAGSGIATAPSVETAAAAIAGYPDAKALLLCSPNYYGMTANMRELVKLAHAAGIPVLVDEAHGAHFGQHPELPGSALQAGADVVVQSTHKMLSSLTMTAMLHMQGSLAPRSAIRQALRMVQSSSPSYPLLASLDLARRALHVQGGALFEPALEVSRSLREALSGLPFVMLNSDDPLKLSLKDARGRLTGFALQHMLERHGCLAEMADASYVVLALGPGTRREDGEALVAALRLVAGELEASERNGQERIAQQAMQPAYQRGSGEEQTVQESATQDRQQQPQAAARMPRLDGAVGPASRPVSIPEPVIIRRRIAATEAVSLREAAGRVCGEWIIPYPPGIPLLYPGELIEGDTVARLERLKAAGARFQGAGDAALDEIQVIAKGD